MEYDRGAVVMSKSDKNALAAVGGKGYTAEESLPPGGRSSGTTVKSCCTVTMTWSAIISKFCAMRRPCKLTLVVFFCEKMSGDGQKSKTYM